MKKMRYGEGDVFLVPLKQGGFARGVIARSAPHGKVLLGYFFGPRLAVAPEVEAASNLRPEGAMRVLRFGDLHLINGAWPIISHVSAWRKEEWPVPKFVLEDPLLGTKYLVSYDSQNPAEEVRREKMTPDDGGEYEQDGMCGAGSVETKLSNML